MKWTVSFACAAMCLGVLGTGAGAVPVPTTLVVSVFDGTPLGWTYENFGSTAGAAFVAGPGVPPAGDGSLAMSHVGPPGANGGVVHTSRYEGVRLDEITALRYDTNQTGAPSLSLFQAPYVQLMLDLDGDDAFDDRIVFEPAWQTGGRPMTTTLNGVPLSPANTVNVEQNGLGSTGGSVAPNTWWEWDLLVGSWWAIPGPGDLLSPDVGVGGAPLVTIAGILEAFPDAKIVHQAGNAINTGGLRIQYGFGGNSDEYVGHVDRLVVSTSTIDETTDFDIDLTPPDVTTSLGRRVLLPVTRGLLDVGLSVLVTDNADPSPAVTVEVWSDEAEGSPPYAPDATYQGGALRLRAERDAALNGRVYLVIAKATDAGGNVGFDASTAVVPISQTVARINQVQAEAAAAEAVGDTTGAPPAGYFRIYPPLP